MGRTELIHGQSDILSGPSLCVCLPAIMTGLGQNLQQVNIKAKAAGRLLLDPSKVICSEYARDVMIKCISLSTVLRWGTNTFKFLLENISDPTSMKALMFTFVVQRFSCSFQRL